MNETIKILFVDDSRDDFLLAQRLLARLPNRTIALDWISDAEQAMERMLAGGHDLCLLDYDLGSRDGLDLLAMVQDRHCSMPIIMLTGAGNYGVDVEAMKLGAADYLVKGQITADQLDRSIRYALARAEQQREREYLFEQLQRALSNEVRVLRGLLPICSCCKKIRDTQGEWRPVEVYIRDNSEADFTHGICPACSVKLLHGLHEVPGQDGASLAPLI